MLLNRLQRLLPTLAIGFFLVAFGAYVYWIRVLASDLKEYSEALSRVYGRWIESVTAAEFLPEGALAEIVLEEVAARIDFPLIITDSNGKPLSISNISVPEDLRRRPESREFQRFVDRQVARLDLQNPPDSVWIGADPPLDYQIVHYGNPPALDRLRQLPYVTGGVLLVFVLLGAWMVRYNLRAQKGEIWVAMARESAHQLGTPLSALKGWTELLRQQASEDDHGGVGTATRSRMSVAAIGEAIEEDLDRLSKVAMRFELVGQRPRLQSTSVEEVLRELDRYFKTRLPSLDRRVELTVSMPTLPEVRANRVLLEWAFENLIKNSLDALRGRGGVIQVQAETREGKRRREVVVRFHDDGPGVSWEIRSLIFRPGVTTKQGGWGVGLTLAKRIVQEYHDGSLRLVESGPAEGTTFEVVLPVVG